MNFGAYKCKKNCQKRTEAPPAPMSDRFKDKRADMK